MEHTKAPWKVIKMKARNGLRDQFFICPNGRFEYNIAEVINSLGVDSEANARLIAAAPDLLEALQEVIRHGLNENIDGYETTLKTVWSAINKAQGI